MVSPAGPANSCCATCAMGLSTPNFATIFSTISPGVIGVSEGNTSLGAYPTRIFSLLTLPYTSPGTLVLSQVLFLNMGFICLKYLINACILPSGYWNFAKPNPPAPDDLLTSTTETP